MKCYAGLILHTNPKLTVDIILIQNLVTTANRAKQEQHEIYYLIFKQQHF